MESCWTFKINPQNNTIICICEGCHQSESHSLMMLFKSSDIPAHIQIQAMSHKEMKEFREEIAVYISKFSEEHKYCAEKM